MNESAPRYEVVRKLADGAVAEVFLSRDRGSGGAEVVLKVLRKELTTDPSVVGRFLDEAKICQTLEHAGVVRHLASGRLADGRVYLVNELLQGEDLGSYLRKNGPLAPADLVQLAVPLCEALDYVHQRGVVHRDLKPDNVFLPGGLRAFRPKLLDFGLANIQGPKSVKTATGVILASPEYTPPECIEGHKAGPYSDIYALGVLLFEALTGAPPFVASNYGELLLKHLNERPADLPETAAELQPVIHRCLAKRPQERFASASEVAAALTGVSEAPVGSTFISRPGTKSATAELHAEGAGELFGDYKTVRLLGEGAMGRVYLAKHTKIGRQVAIKVLLPEHARNSQLVQRFFQEARTVNEINHEHIVEIFDFKEEAGPNGEQRVYCVLELLTGASLSALARVEPLSVRRVARIGQQLCSALAAAHRVGVVHRDIKPDNIFITERSGVSDYVKVLDFGVAKLVVPLADAPKVGTMAGAIIGTPAYMAPEQASGAGTDFRADIYAVGVVLYELLTGRVPFEGEVFGKLVVQIMTKPPPPMGERTVGGEPIPKELEQWVMRCLSKEPQGRPPSMEALEQALASIAADASSTKGVVASDVEVIERPRRSKAPMVAVLGVLAALGGGGAFLVFNGAENRAPEPVAAPVEPNHPAPPAQVQLTLDSKPEGARVLRSDTNEQVGLTPLRTHLDKSDQPLTFRLELDGYEVASREVTPSADTVLEVVLAEKPKPAAEVRRPPKRPKKQGPKKAVSDESTLDPFAD
ncbi:MAG: serine/threonine-protein kinase [Myxococcota bacterium]